MSLDKVPINAFDAVLLVTLLTGMSRGRKHGMSEELMPLLKWLLIALGCALAYEPLGQFVAGWKLVSLLGAYVIAYATVALLVLGFFALIKYRVGGKLLGSDIFGQTEYYLGMGSGVIRFCCILVAVLALLNARYYAPSEVKAMEKFQNDVYGSNFFPTLHTVQSTVFERSLTGPWIKDHLAFLLIKPTEPNRTPFRQREVTMP